MVQSRCCRVDVSKARICRIGQSSCERTADSANGARMMGDDRELLEEGTHAERSYVGAPGGPKWTRQKTR